MRLGHALATLLTFAGVLALLLAWVQVVSLVLKGYRARLIEGGAHR